MSESKHTPGPWHADRFGSIRGGPEREYTNGWAKSQVASAVLGEGLTEEERNANAALIARAPDLLRENESLRAQNAELLEVLQYVKDDVEGREDNGISRDSYTKISRAIAKAKGGDS